jgi:hypothetical protein
MRLLLLLLLSLLLVLFTLGKRCNSLVLFYNFLLQDRKEHLKVVEQNKRVTPLTESKKDEKQRSSNNNNNLIHLPPKS